MLPTPPVPSVTPQAVNNDWGAGSSPSWAGLGDAAGSVSDRNDAVMITRSFATTAATATPLP